MAKSKASSETQNTGGRKPLVKKTVKKKVGKKQLSKTLKRKVASKKVSKTSIKKAKRKPKKILMWKISPEKFGVTDVWGFKKDGVTIKLSQNYRFSFFVVAQNSKLTKYDPDKGANIDEFKYSYYESGDDARGPDWTFPDDFSLEEQERIKILWDEEYDDAMQKAGWTCSMETYLHGPLLIEDVGSEYPHDPV